MNQDKTPMMVLEEFVKENQVQGFNFMIINSEILLEKIQSLKGMDGDKWICHCPLCKKELKCDDCYKIGESLKEPLIL